MRRCSRGFSLVELLVATGLLGLAVGGLLSFFAQAMELNDVNRDLSLAVSHAQYVLEDIRSSSGVIITQMDGGVWNYDTDAEFSDRGLARLQNETILVEHDAATPPVITLTLDWLMPNGRPQQLIFETIDSGV